LIFLYTLSFSASTKKKAPGKGGSRYYKNVGLGFKTPREAIEGTCDAPGD
jgi:small subunit ribosomal protein S11e